MAAEVTPEALAAELETRAKWYGSQLVAPSSARLYATIEELLSEYAGKVAKLAPAHAALTGQLAAQHEAMTQLRADHAEALAALTAERDGLRDDVVQLGVQLGQADAAVDQLGAERDRYRAALEAIAELASRAKPVMWWSGTRTESAWTLDQVAVTAIAREALEGGRAVYGGPDSETIA